MFFDNEVFLRFKENCLIKGINIPIIAGIMPITNANQIKRSVELAGCKFPKKFERIIERFGEMCIRDSCHTPYRAGTSWRSCF